MNRKTFYIKTLGCKVNQYETQGIREVLGRDGYHEVDTPKDAAYIIINSCTVTHHSDRKTFYFIRRTKKMNDAATIVLTGCTAENDEHELLYEKGADIIVTNDEKSRIAEILAFHRAHDTDHTPHVKPIVLDTFSDMPISSFKGHSRAFVKIQDGCNMNCSYCKVRIVRGRSRSRSLSSIVDEVVRLVDNGYKEIVLTGVQLGAFGRDLTTPTSLVALLDILSDETGVERIRISSLEPFDVTDALIESMANNPKICPHLHLPLQSGDDTILRRMRRTYTHDKFESLIMRLKSNVPSFALTTDVIVGFPGEDDKAFRNTFDLLSKTEPFKMHIFPFSAREGTDAASYEGIVQSSIITERERALHTLNDELFLRTSSVLVGKSLPVLIEEVIDDGRTSKGRLNDYRSVVVPGECYNENDVVTLSISEVQKGYLVGAPLK